MDYKYYTFERKELILELIKGSILIFVICFLFFDSFWLALPCQLLLIPYIRMKKKDYLMKRDEELKLQFSEGLRSLSTALQAGYSVENALREAASDLRRQNFRIPYMQLEFDRMLHRIAASETIEAVFRDFGERSGLSDALLFADIFAAAKRSGRDLTKVIGTTIRMLREKTETDREIQLMITSQKYELKIMSLMPLVMLMILKMSSGAFLQVMYTTIAGRLIMLGCLIAYGGIREIGQRMIRIKVA